MTLMHLIICFQTVTEMFVRDMFYKGGVKINCDGSVPDRLNTVAETADLSSVYYRSKIASIFRGARHAHDARVAATRKHRTRVSMDVFKNAGLACRIAIDSSSGAYTISSLYCFTGCGASLNYRCYSAAVRCRPIRELIKCIKNVPPPSPPLWVSCPDLRAKHSF